jgi:hypothetical protein
MRVNNKKKANQLLNAWTGTAAYLVVQYLAGLAHFGGPSRPRGGTFPCPLRNFPGVIARLPHLTHASPPQVLWTVY